MQILLIEDSRDIQSIVKTALGHYTVTIAVSATEAIQVLSGGQFDLILMDLGLPDEDGLSLCARIQSENRTKNTPIFILTSNAGIETKLAAFSLGVDDYIVKPFHPLELRARIETRLKKAEKGRVEDEVLTRSNLQLNLSRQKAYSLSTEPPKDLGLTPLEFKILYQLARHPEHVLSRNQLLNLVWGEGSHVLDRTVDTHVSVLRKKLGRQKGCIQAVTGEGYRFSPNGETTDEEVP